VPGAAYGIASGSVIHARRPARELGLGDALRATRSRSIARSASVALRAADLLAR